MEIIFGIHAVGEVLKSRPKSISHVAVARERSDLKLQRIIDGCRAAGIPVRFENRQQLDRMAKSASHQGVVAGVTAKQYSDLEDILEKRRGQWAFIVVLDGVEDPHNLGAIIRTADAAGADGIVIPERRATGVTGTVVKTSAGASEHLPVARVTNIARSVEDLKAENIWTVGLDERGGQSYDQLDYKMDCALVLGAEGKGLRQLTRETCAAVARLDMPGEIKSLNVSNAAVLALYVGASRLGLMGK